MIMDGCHTLVAIYPFYYKYTANQFNSGIVYQGDSVEKNT